MGIYITIQTPTTATCEIRNLSTRQRISKPITAPDPESYIRGWQVEWIIEEQTSTGFRVAGFGTVRWDKCRAGTAVFDGNVVDVKKAFIQDNPIEGRSVADVKIRSQGEFDVGFKH